MSYSKLIKKISAGFVAAVVLLSTMAGIILASGIGSNVSAERITPYQRYGAIQVKKIPANNSAGYVSQLCDQNGNPIQLRGMSTHGIQWGDGNWIFNNNAFDALAYDWQCDIIRLAMYVNEDGYASHPSDLLSRVETGIQMATNRGMYVLVDWHVLTPGNPNDSSYLNAGKSLPQFAAIRNAHPDYNGPQLFFAYLSQKYGSQGNVLFEIANEPNNNGDENNASQTWNNVLRPYHQKIVDAIRLYDSDSTANIVICGTDNWSQFVNAPASNPISDSKGQVMYTVHFYTGTHDINGSTWLRDKVSDALNRGLAVFATEWGTSRSDGNGGVYTDNANMWLNFLKDKGISWCAWSLGKVNESSAAFIPRCQTTPTDHNGDGIPDWASSDLTTTGTYLREKIKENRTNEISYGQLPTVTVNRGAVEGLVSRFYTNLLGRQPDSNGLNYWTNLLINGETVGSCAAYGFVFSDEMNARNLDNQQFITVLYTTFLNREPSWDDINYWSNVMNQGASREAIFASLANSDEFGSLCGSAGIASGYYQVGAEIYSQTQVNAFVNRLYISCLGRAGDRGGMEYWVKALLSHQLTGAQAANNFIFSPEFTGFNVSPEDYVRVLYRAFMGRDAASDPNGLNYWVGKINSGASRRSVFTGFVNSNEFSSICSSYGIVRGSV